MLYADDDGLVGNRTKLEFKDRLENSKVALNRDS